MHPVEWLCRRIVAGRGFGLVLTADDACQGGLSVYPVSSNHVSAPTGVCVCVCEIRAGVGFGSGTETSHNMLVHKWGTTVL